MSSSTDDDITRAIYLCQDCGAHYLPPADLTYGHGIASEVFCASCQPAHTPDSAARPGVDLAATVRRARTRGPRRAGHQPARRRAEAGGDPSGRRR